MVSRLKIGGPTRRFLLARPRPLPVALAAAALLLLAVRFAAAQVSLLAGGHAQPVSNTQPVTFLADQVSYNRQTGIVTATGHVEAWQGDHIVYADKMTFDRNTNVAAAIGHVVMLEPSGQVLFSNYAELSRNMKNGVMKGMSVRLAQNAKLAANGARRTGGQINELSKAVYSTCNVCRKNPNIPPLWAIRASSAVQDLQHKRIEYKDAVMEIYGLPVAYFPFFFSPDPSVKRASGLLIPSVGESSHLGAFASIPYFWVIDKSSDATIIPTLATQTGPQLQTIYRKRFNDGEIRINAAAAYDQHKPQGYLFAHGVFDLNSTWRYGFDFNRASSTDYLRDFNILPSANTLNSQVYLEGFGPGAYARIDTRFYQALQNSVVASSLPVVLPYARYSFFGEPDAWGGRFSADTSFFNVLRQSGTSTARGALTMNYEKPFTGQFGDLWKLQFHLDAAVYSAHNLNELPNFGTANSAETARALPQVALDYRWPLMRDAGRWGTQIIEPIAQLIVAPNIGNRTSLNIPNEDSLDLQFTDANLFGFNKFPGIDRLEGGTRVNVGLHGAWYMGGSSLDALIGQSYRLHKDTTFPVGSGLSDNVSDIVGHVSLSPTPWLDLTYRTRLDHKTFQQRFIDATASVGNNTLRVTGGYLYTATDPYFLYDSSPPPTSVNTPRNEIMLSATTHLGQWRLSGYTRRDLQSAQFVSAGLDAAYENECLVFEVKFDRRFTSLNGDHGATALLFQVTFKTLGTVGFGAL
ncbi:MAG TPA: LPS assembly protein LptD [Acetobacteraceae bacterium]|nr:LPS assembly protein LptD [Acetobacteraceae bacterium]